MIDKNLPHSYDSALVMQIDYDRDFSDFRQTEAYRARRMLLLNEDLLLRLW